MCECVTTNQAEAPVPASWINESGRVVHPDAPAGLGGLGAFRAASVLGTDSSAEMLPDAKAPATRNLDPSVVELAGETEAKKAKRQPAPRIANDAADELVHQIVTIKLKADESGVSGIKGALTDITSSNNGAQVVIHSDEKGIVDDVTNDLTWTAEVVTQYGSGDPEGDAAYGRGTTPADRDAGNVTLGFHESCHRADLLAYLRTEPIPTLDIDYKNKKIPRATAEAARSAYIAAWTAYFAKARKNSVTSTDEAPGSDPTLSKFKAPGSKP